MSRYILGSGQDAVRLCEALGLTANQTRKIEIQCEAGDVMKITVESRLSRDQFEGLVTVMRRYKLVLREEEIIEPNPDDITALNDLSRRYQA